MKDYDPRKWYWRVGGDQGRVYSSAIGDYVQNSNALFQAWISDGTMPTNIDTEANLGVVLSSYNGDMPVPLSVGIFDSYRQVQADEIARKLTVFDRIRPIEHFGGGTDVADNTPAFNKAVAAGRAVRFLVPGGTYTFSTEPAVINKSFAILGPVHGVIDANIMRNYVPSAANRGLFHWNAGAQYCVSDLFIMAKSGAAGSAISIVPPVGGASGSGSIHNVRVSVNGGTWDHCIYVDGSNLTSPIGVRCLDLRNVVLFGTNIRSAFFKSVVHLNWHGGAINQSGGVIGNMEITGTASAPSSENTISLDYMSNNLVLDRVSNSTIRVGEMGSSVTNTSNTSGIVGDGILLGGAPQSNWINSSWRSGRTTHLSPT